MVFLFGEGGNNVDKPQTVCYRIAIVLSNETYRNLTDFLLFTSAISEI